MHVYIIRFQPKIVAEEELVNNFNVQDLSNAEKFFVET